MIFVLLLLFTTPSLQQQVNDYRQQSGLPALQYSDSLSKVALAHCKDLYDNYRDCNLHSWSKSPIWKGGCVEKEGWDIMWDKPREIAGMDADGFEIAHMHFPKDDPCSPECALSNWKKSPPHNNILLEKGWRPFKKMGVAIYRGVATVWFTR
jgi:hypothetical protein